VAISKIEYNYLAVLHFVIPAKAGMTNTSVNRISVSASKEAYDIIIVMAIKTIATNRKAYHNYHILESMEAGIVLTGTEIKSIRAGKMSLSDAYVKPEKGELWLLNAHIARYDNASYMSHEPTRPRKLLLHRREIAGLTSKLAEKGLTLVPLKVYIKDSNAKVEIAVAKGKKLYDKRESIARRDSDMEIRRAVKKRSQKTAAGAK
jgi:SsrA-binding protein